MKKILRFVKKKKRDPPPGSAASACSAGAYEIRPKELTKLHRGAAAGDLALVQQGLKKHDIDERDKAQRTPLHLACANGREDVVTFLVENKCKLNLLDGDNRSPLMKAVQCQKERCAVILLEHGADPNLADAGGNTALHLAAVAPNRFLAGMLIEHSARINAQNKDGCTPLTLAISENHKEMVELLLKKGADVHTRDPCERTPLMTAAAGGELKLVKMLLRYGAEIFHKDVNGWTAEDYAIIHGNASLSKKLAEYADRENAGEASAGAEGGIPVPVTPHQARAAGFTLGAAASSRGEMQQSPEQTPRTGESSEAMDDFFEGDSTSSEKEGSNGTWNTSEEEELDFTAKKPQKPNLTMLMNVPQKFRNIGGGDSSRIEIPKSQKKSLKQKKPTGANLNRGECGELLKQDVSDSSNLEEDELGEEEEEDEDDDGDDNEEHGEEEEDLTYAEKEEEDLDNEETQSDDIMEEEQRGKIELKEEVNQKLGYLSNVKNEGDAQCGAGSVSSDSQKVLKKSEEKIEESVDTPVSFIDGRYEKLQENVTALSPTKMNNEVSYQSVPKQAVLRNTNNLQDEKERCRKKSMIQKTFHRNTASCFDDSETTSLKKGIPQPLSNSGHLLEKSRFSGSFKSRSGSWSAAENLNLENQRPSSVMDDEDDDEGQCKEKESPKWKEEQEKEDTRRKLQTTVLGDVKHSVSSNKHQVRKVSEDTAYARNALRAVGAEKKEESDSPWDSEPGSDSPRMASLAVSLPAADEHGVSSLSVSWEHNEDAQPAVGAEKEKESDSPWDSEPCSESLKMASLAVSLPAADEHGVRLQSVSGENNKEAQPTVGAEKKEESDSPWDSEPCSEGPRKASPPVFLPPADEHGVRLQSVSGENNKEPQPAVGAEKKEESDSPWDSEPCSESPRKASPPVFLPAADELGLHLQSVSGEHNKGLSEKPSNLQLKVSAVLEMNETSSKTEKQKSDPQEKLSVDDIEGERSESTVHVSSSAKKEMVNDATENFGRQDKYVLETTNLIENTAHEKQTDKAEISHQEALAENEESHSADKQLSLRSWEERYERMWIEKEKRELKRNFTNITAELKQLFGEINESEKAPSLVAEVSEDDLIEEWKSLCVSSCVTESSDKLESKGEFGDVKLNVDLKESKPEIVIPSLCVLPDHSNLNASVENTWRIPDEEGCANYTDNTKVHLSKAEEMEENENGISRNVEGSPEYSLRHCLKTNIWDDISNNLPNIRPVSTNGESTLGFISEKKIDKDICLSDSVSRDCLIKNKEIGETEIENLFPLAQQPCGMLKRNLDEELKQDVERFKSKVEKEKRKRKHFKMQAVEKQESLDKSNTPAGNITHQPVKEKLALRKNEKMIEEKHTKNSSSEERPKLLEMPVKGFSVKQEEEKRHRAEMRYEKTRKQLKREEDQYSRETEEKQQLEFRVRNLETELITLKQLKKQVEEERDETQRQLSNERSARALQEGILSNHLWRQKELEEETRKTIGKNSEKSDTNDREKDLLHRNQLLQEEIAMLRLELDQVKLKHQEDEGKYLEENESLKEKNDSLQKELKLSEETLTQTVFQYNGQLNLLRTESAMLTSKLEQKKESKDRLETEIESFCSRLNAVVQDLERHQSLKSDAERTFQRERDEWLRLQDKLHRELSEVRESNKSLSQQLSKTESKVNSLENELHQLKQTLQEKTQLLEMTQKDLNQAQCQAKENEHAWQLEKDQVSKFMIKHESMQERLAQLQSENLLLHQQLEDLQNKGIIKEKVVNDVQDRFHDMFNKLRADSEKQVYLMEERNKELNTKCTDLREQVFKYETDKVEREGLVRQLQQELADALKKQSMSEASLEVTTRYRSDLEEDKLRLQKELDRIKAKLHESEQQRIQSERCIQDLKTDLDNKERQISASNKKMEDLLLAASRSSSTIKQLEEHVQRLEMKNAGLEAAVQHQDKRTEASVHSHLEDLITGLRTVQTVVEEYQHQQIQNQNMLAMTSRGSRMMCEEDRKSRAHLEDHIAKLSRENAELLEECENERKQVKKLIELKQPLEACLDRERERNTELQKECDRFKRLLKKAVKKLKMHEAKERDSQFNFQGEMKNRYSEMVNEVDKLSTKVTELSHQLDLECKKCVQLQGQNHDLQEELALNMKKHEKLEKTRCQLKEEVANLRQHLEAVHNVHRMTYNQIERYKKEVEERAAQEINQKLQEVNLFLQVQAASQDKIEQIRENHHASLRDQLKCRIKELECELDKIKNTKDNIFQNESMLAEVEKYKELYREEMKMRIRLANKLERTTERLAEANCKLFEERLRNKSLIASSTVSGGFAASPGKYSAELGNLSHNSALNRSFSQVECFLDAAGTALLSRKKVAVYLDKISIVKYSSVMKTLGH